MYAFVRNGSVQRVFDDLPDSYENISGVKYLSPAELAAFGVYQVVDQRPALVAGKHYENQTYTFTGSGVTLTAVLVNNPPPTQAELDATAVKAYPQLVALKNMTPAQVQAWVEANVTTLATAKGAIKTLAVAVGFLARGLYND